MNLLGALAMEMIKTASLGQTSSKRWVLRRNDEPKKRENVSMIAG
jgi:hypothetical protein